MEPLVQIPISRSWSNPYTLEELIDRSDIAFFDKFGPDFNVVYLLEIDITVKDDCYQGVGVGIYDGGLYAPNSGTYLPASIDSIASSCTLLGQGREEIIFTIWAFWQEHLAEIKSLYK